MWLIAAGRLDGKLVVVVKHLSIWLASALVLSGCDISTGDVPKHNTRDAPSAADAKRDADRAWAELTSSGHRVEQAPGENAYAYFLRRVELANQRRRDLGLEFWNTYKDDPRRYEWLMLSVHMAPYYPVDIIGWAEAQASIFTDQIFERDEARISAWQKEYRDMRRAFLAAEDVSAEQRRFLLASELRNDILGFSLSRSEYYDQSLVALLTKVEAFFRAYPEPFSAEDSSTHASLVQTVLELLFEGGSGRLNSHLDVVRDTLRSWEVMDDSVIAPYARVCLVQITQRGRLPGPENRWRTLYDARFIPGTDRAASIVRTNEKALWRRALREFGLQLYQTDDNLDERIGWFVMTVLYPPHYPFRWIDGLREVANSELLAYEKDTNAVKAWNAQYERIRSELLSDAESEDEKLLSLKRGVARADLWRLRGIRPGDKPDPNHVRALLEDIWSLQELEGGAYYTALFTNVVIRDRVFFGLSLDQLSEYLERFRSRQDESLRQVAITFDSMSAALFEPFDLTAKTIDGESMSISDFRGKVLLIDHWTTSCSSCIVAMPDIHEVYLQYRDAGFEVISIVYDWKENSRLVKRIEDELKLEWKTLVGDDFWPEISSRFGYSAWPQYMLLDRNGMIVAGTGEVDYGRNLIPLIEAMLANDPAAEVAERTSTPQPSSCNSRDPI